MANKKNIITKSRKQILALALPMATMQFILVFSSFICMTMLARLGQEILAASALIFSSQLTGMVICMSILFSLSILISHAFGAKNYTVIGAMLQQGWLLSIMIAIPAICIFLNIQKILIFFGQKASLAALVQTFFQAYVWGFIPLLFSVCNQQLCYAVGKQRLVILTGVLEVIILVLVAYTFIFGKFGFPQLGVAGLGYALAAQSWFYFLFTTAFFYFDNCFKSFAIFNFTAHKNWQSLAQMFSVGWPISLLMSGEMLSFFITSTMVGWISVNALAAYQILLQYIFIVVVPIFAISQASGILISQARGSQQFQQIKSLGQISLQLTLIISLVVAIVMLLMSKFLASVYLDIRDPHNAEILHLTILLFVIVAFSQVFDATKNLLFGALRGLLDTKYPMFIGLASLWLVGLPLSYFFAFNRYWGVVGIAIGTAIGMLVGATGLYLRWYKLTSASLFYKENNHAIEL